MLTSTVLKRSLMQVCRSSAVSPVTQCCRSVSSRFAPSGAEDQLDSGAETHHTNPSDCLNNELRNNGTIQFQMTPKHEFGTLSERQQYGGASIDTSDKYEDQYGTDPFMDQTAAAEQMMNIMENSYYFASYKAGGKRQEGLKRSR